MSLRAFQSIPDFTSPLAEPADRYELRVAPGPTADQPAVFGQLGELAYLLDVQIEASKATSIAGLVQVLRILRDAELAKD